MVTLILIPGKGILSRDEVRHRQSSYTDPLSIGLNERNGL